MPGTVICPRADGLGMVVIHPDGSATQLDPGLPYTSSGMGGWFDDIVGVAKQALGAKEAKEVRRAARSQQRLVLAQMEAKRRGNLTTAFVAIGVGLVAITGLVVYSSTKRRRR